MLFVTVASCLANTFWSITRTDAAVNSRVALIWISANRYSCVTFIESNSYELWILINALSQVDAGLRFENRKQKYQYMFNVKTPKRIYYLVAENEVDMNKWVDAVCQVCGLKAYTQDEEQQSNGI